MRRFVSWSGHAWLALPARGYLAWLFIAACLHKIAHPASFALDIATYDILPVVLVHPLAIGLPWVELVAGLALVLGFRTRAAALAVSGMLVLFMVAIAIALAKGLDLSCGCFASQALEQDPISGWTLVRDAGWLALSLYVALFDRNPLGLDRWLVVRRQNG